jgi:hypothetical protein
MTVNLVFTRLRLAPNVLLIPGTGLAGHLLETSPPST